MDTIKPPKNSLQLLKFYKCLKKKMMESFKMLKDDYSSSEASSSDSEDISSEVDSNKLYSSDEHSVTCVPDTPQKAQKFRNLHLHLWQNVQTCSRNNKSTSTTENPDQCNKNTHLDTCTSSQALSCHSTGEPPAGNQWDQLLVHGTDREPFSQSCSHKHDKILLQCKCKLS